MEQFPIEESGTVYHKVVPKPFQLKFYNSVARFPALVSAIGTGKTYFFLLKIWNFCKTYPNTLALIVRKEYTDLRDSTIKDFERYFNAFVNSNKEYRFENGSLLMFRHGDELNVLKNINLTIFGIEQAEEFDSDENFTMLRDRLRRDNAPIRQGIIIANTNGDNWIKELWKGDSFNAPKLQESELFEANTFDNEDNLPKDFIQDLKRMELESPAHYKQYVLNDWSVNDSEFVLIRSQSIEDLRYIEHHYDYRQRIISCDPSTGGDECVIYVIENGEIIHEKMMHENDTMKISAEIAAIGNEFDVDYFAIDSIGVGKGVADDLYRIVKGKEKTVYFVNSAELADDKKMYFNKRTEMWWYLNEKILNKEIPYVVDAELRRQLCAVKYESIKNKGRVKLEDKQLTKKRLRRSPDRADAFVYGIYYMQFVAKRYSDRIEPKDRYKVYKQEEESRMSIVNF